MHHSPLQAPSRPGAFYTHLKSPRSQHSIPSKPVEKLTGAHPGLAALFIQSHGAWIIYRDISRSLTIYIPVAITSSPLLEKLIAALLGTTDVLEDIISIAPILFTLHMVLMFAKEFHGLEYPLKGCVYPVDINVVACLSGGIFNKFLKLESEYSWYTTQYVRLL